MAAAARVCATSGACFRPLHVMRADCLDVDFPSRELCRCNAAMHKISRVRHVARRAREEGDGSVADGARCRCDGERGRRSGAAQPVRAATAQTTPAMRVDRPRRKEAITQRKTSDVPLSVSGVARKSFGQSCRGGPRIVMVCGGGERNSLIADIVRFNIRSRCALRSPTSKVVREGFQGLRASPYLRRGSIDVRAKVGVDRLQSGPRRDHAPQAHSRPKGGEG